MKSQLDPLSGMTDDTILSAGENISKDDLFIHYNINNLVEQLMEENPLFMSMAMKDKRDALEVLATAEMEEMKAEKLKNVVDVQTPDKTIPPTE